MKACFIFLFILCGSYVQAQNCGGLSKEEFFSLEQIVRADVEHWPQSLPDSLSDLIWKIFPLIHCKHDIEIAHNNKKYTFDLLNEIRRRTMGGFAGSYPFAESWTLEYNEAQLIQKVKTIIKNKPELQTEYDQLSKDKSGKWFYFSIRRPNTEERINFWVRGSKIALVSFYNKTDEVQLSYLKMINKDFWYGENKARIQEFEKLIIDKIIKE